MLFEFNIFPKFFTHYEKRSDINKDANGKGTLERFNESMGADIDNEITPLIENLLANIYVPDTCMARYVPYLESMLGYDYDNYILYFDTTIATRRKILRHILRYYTIKGTIPGYTLLFYMLGMTTVTITELIAAGSFDSPDTFDDPDNTLDMFCPNCGKYEIDLIGPGALTTTLLNAIMSIIRFNEPIDMRLVSLTYNGTPISLAPDYNGDFNNDFNS